ncbi:MAG: hypothetical protein IJP43_04785 [Oscillospiraceae bacterium]|nr:hypothetical protein [Oscillospiraceae bacterium]
MSRSYNKDIFLYSEKSAKRRLSDEREKQKLISILLMIAMLVGLFPGMTITARADADGSLAAPPADSIQ